MKLRNAFAKVSRQALAAVAAAAYCCQVAAAPPAAQLFEFDVTFQSGFWSGQCGVPVYIRQAGKVSVRLFFDPAGTTIVKELDTLPGFRETVSSPANAGGTGKSFSYARSEPTRFVYPEGATLGAPALVYDTGLGGFYAPGFPVAGRTVLSGVVSLVDSDGIPFVDVIGLLEHSGRQISFANAVAARCGFLANP